MVSSDLGDMIKVTCHLCEMKPQLSNMRNHTKKAHGMTIAAYKEKFSVEIIERVYHRSLHLSSNPI